MSAIELTEIPISGQLEEVNFGTSNNLYRVKFTDKGVNSWVGKFNFGLGEYSTVLNVDDSHAVIIAGGDIYYINFKQRKILFSVIDAGIRGVIVHNNEIIVHTYRRIQIYSFTGDILYDSRNDKAILDDLIFEKIENNVLYGVFYSSSYSDTKGSFMLDILTRTITTRIIITQYNPPHKDKYNNTQSILARLKSLFSK